MKRAINTMSRYFLNQSLGLLLIRVAVGLLFLSHGWMKMHNLTGTVAMFAHMGFPMWVGYFIAYLEVVGGLALIFGVATRIFALAFGIEMLVAVLINPLSHAVGGTELLLSVASFGIALTGSGRFALWRLECSSCGGMLCSPNSPDCAAR